MLPGKTSRERNYSGSKNASREEPGDYTIFPQPCNPFFSHLQLKFDIIAKINRMPLATRLNG
jgi:hypothetical protein